MNDINIKRRKTPRYLASASTYQKDYRDRKVYVCKPTEYPQDQFPISKREFANSTHYGHTFVKKKIPSDPVVFKKQENPLKFMGKGVDPVPQQSCYQLEMPPFRVCPVHRQLLQRRPGIYGSPRHDSLRYRTDEPFSIYTTNQELLPDPHRYAFQAPPIPIYPRGSLPYNKVEKWMKPPKTLYQYDFIANPKYLFKKLRYGMTANPNSHMRLNGPMDLETNYTNSFKAYAIVKEKKKESKKNKQILR